MIIREYISKNKRGSTTILAILIMGVVLISALYLVYLTKLQSYITNSSIDKIQSYYLAESKINKAFYDDKYYLNYIYPFIKDNLSSSGDRSFTLKLDVLDIDTDDKDSTVKCTLPGYTSDSKRNIVLEAKSIYKDIQTSINAYGTIVNDFYELQVPILSINTYPEMEELFLCIKDNISKGDFPSGTNYRVITTYDHDRVVITNDKTIKLFRNSFETEGVKARDRNILIFENTSINKPIDFQIGEDENGKEIKLEGLIYVDGDLYINSKFIFRGIIIVNGNTYINPNVVTNSDLKGIVLTSGVIDDKSFIKYDRSFIYRYGVYLPDFIKPRLEVFKKL